jgi:hypothetical protein
MLWTMTMKMQLLSCCQWMPLVLINITSHLPRITDIPLTNINRARRNNTTSPTPPEASFVSSLSLEGLQQGQGILWVRRQVLFALVAVSKDLRLTSVVEVKRWRLDYGKPKRKDSLFSLLIFRLIV